MRTLGALAMVPIALAFLAWPSAADASFSVEPDYLRLSSVRSYLVAIEVDASWSCDSSERPPGRPMVSVHPDSYEEELGVVWRIVPDYQYLQWTTTTGPDGRPLHYIDSSLEASVERVGQPFEARSTKVSWSASHINIGSDCVVSERERTGLSKDMTIDVPIIASTYEPRNTPGEGLASTLLVWTIVAAVAGARRRS